MAIREWAGMSTLAVVGIGVSAAGVYRSWPDWIVILVAVVTAVGVSLMYPIVRTVPASTVTFKGDLVGSEIDGVTSSADHVVLGSIQNSVVRNVAHRVRRLRRR